MKNCLLASIIALLLTHISCGQALASLEHRALIIATQRWPDLTVPGSPHFEAFNDLLTRSIAAKSVVFKDPEWPLRIAEKSRSSLPALKQGRERFGPLPIEKYEEKLREMLNSESSATQELARLELAAYQAELGGDHEAASKLRAQIAQKKLLGQIQARLSQLEAEIWQLKRSLQ